MLTVGVLVDDILAGPVTFEYWAGEVVELCDELVLWNWRGIREEWGDVCALGLAHLVAQGWPLRWVPLLPGLGLGSALKFRERLQVWERIFEHHKVAFRREYLIGGGNYRKLHKIIAALSLAGVQQVDTAWLISERLTETR